MSTSYKELLAQREALEQKIKQAHAHEVAAALARARTIVAEYGLTAEDVFSSGKRAGAGKGTKVAAKYRNPSTGETWTGRGKAPRWIRIRTASNT
jgi:DNA-binding protein H-NS